MATQQAKVSVKFFWDNPSEKRCIAHRSPRGRVRCEMPAFPLHTIHQGRGKAGQWFGWHDDRAWYPTGPVSAGFDRGDPEEPLFTPEAPQDAQNA